MVCMACFQKGRRFVCCFQEMACSHGLFLLIPIWIIKHFLKVFEVANNGRASINGGRTSTPKEYYRCREQKNGLAYWSDRILKQHGSMFLFSLENNFIALVCEISCLINCEFDNKLCARASIRDQRITICRIIVPISAYRTYRNFLVNPIRPSYRVPSSHRVVELMDVFIGCGKVQDVGRPR